MAESDLFEKMLAMYPAEKRELARQVFHRFAEGDSTQFFTQLLLVLDVYAHYAERVPKATVQAAQDLSAILQDRTNSSLKSFVISYQLKGPSDSILEKLSTEMRQPFSNPAVKNASEKAIQFLNHKAMNFTYEMPQNGQMEFFDVTIFATENAGWAVLCGGPPEQRDEVVKILDFYQSKAVDHP